VSSFFIPLNALCHVANVGDGNMQLEKTLKQTLYINNL